MIWNPWKRIRELEARNAYLEGKLDYMDEDVRRHVSDAVYHGIEREVYRRRQLEAQNAHLIQQMTTASELSFPGSIIAKMKAD